MLCTLLPLVCWRQAGQAGVGAAPGAIWQRHRHLHNVIFYLISHSKCNQKLMRALSCLADWQHDSALTPNINALHPNDAILKPSLCSYRNPIYNCVCERRRQTGSGCVFIVLLCVHERGEELHHLVTENGRETKSTAGTATKKEWWRREKRAEKREGKDRCDREGFNVYHTVWLYLGCLAGVTVQVCVCFWESGTRLRG